MAPHEPRVRQQRFRPPECSGSKAGLCRVTQGADGMSGSKRGQEARHHREVKVSGDSDAVG